MTESQGVRPGVRTAGVADWPAVSAAIAAAFETDPLFSWMLPDEDRRPGALRRYFAIEAKHIALAHGLSVAATDGTGTLGAALVLPPDRWRMPVGVLAAHGAGYLRVFGGRTPRALGVLTAIERCHLRRPHYYLAYIGVIPAAQNRGLGGALLEPIVARCDREGVPAYLEASNPACARLYERLGFATVRQIRPLGAPPVRLMVREPR